VEMDWEDPRYPPGLIGEHLSSRPRRSIRQRLDLIP
jgi:hypothetical protein